MPHRAKKTYEYLSKVSQDCRFLNFHKFRS